MAVEILGGWQDSCAHHGLRHRHLFRSREKTKKEITFRLFVGKFKVSIYDFFTQVIIGRILHNNNFMPRSLNFIN